MRKKLKGVLLFSTLAMIATSSSVSAATGYGLSVGTNYGSGVSSVGEATDASNALKEMGYNTTLITVPTKSELTSNSAAGRPRLESDILFFNGHASAIEMEWNYLNKGGSYAVGIESRGQNATWGGFNFIGLGQYKLSNIKLAIFMGCETAAVPQDSSRVNIAVYTKNLGAKTTIGWNKKIAQLDTQRWTQRFFSALKAGFTVQDAANFANNGMYSDSNIKSNYVMGVGTATLNSNTTVMKKSDSTNSVKFDSGSVKSNIAKYIVDNINPDFNEDDYLVQSVENSAGIVYDYYFSPNGVKTTLGYTITVDNNKFAKIVDNTNGVDLLDLGEKISKKTSSVNSMSKVKSNDNSMLTEFLADVDDDYQRTVIDTETIYDIETDKIYTRYLIDEENTVNNTSMIIEKRIEM